VRLWSNVLLFSKHKAKIASVVSAVRAHSLLDHAELSVFMSSRSNTVLRGFPAEIDPPNFAALHELLGENWVGERILDTRAHQVMAAVNSKSNGSPVLLILPSIFHIQLANTYRANCLSKQLKEIRESLLTDLPHVIAFASNKKDVHWTPSAVVTKDRCVRQGDSLQWAPDTALLAKLRWFLSDVVETQGEWTEKDLSVPLQGSRAGSCGIIAISVIHSLADPTVPVWREDTALEFRLGWLKELLRHHIKTVRDVSVYIPITKSDI
jgi:hypothetical protein